MNYMMLNRLSKYERQCLSEMYDELYPKVGITKSLYEGHTLLNHIDKIINVYNIVNERLKDSTPINDKEITISIRIPNYNPYKLTGMYYEIVIPFNELGIDDIIKSKNHNLKLKIFNIDNYEYLPEDIWNKVSGGHLLHTGTDEVENGVYIQNSNLKQDKMFIDCYALDGDIEPIGFYTVFLHEFNHYVEGFNRVKNNTHIDFIKSVIKFNSLEKSIKEDKRFFTNKDKASLNNVLYRLWQGGEKNSLIGNLFGELVARKVKDETNIGDLINNYKLFYTYEKLKEDIQHIIDNIDEKDLYNFFFVCNVYDFILGNKSVVKMTPHKFKKFFIEHSEDLLKRLYKKGVKFIGDYLKVVSKFDNNHISKHIYVK